MNKSKSKALLQLAGQLPACYIDRNHTEHAPLSRLYQLIDEGHDIQGLPPLTEENADTLHAVTYTTSEVFNHHKRLKAAWKMKGVKGIQEYLLWVDLHNRRYKGRMKAQSLDPGLLEIAKAGVSSFWKMLLAFLVGFVRIFQNNEK